MSKIEVRLVCHDNYNLELSEIEIIKKGKNKIIINRERSMGKEVWTRLIERSWYPCITFWTKRFPSLNEALEHTRKKIRHSLDEVIPEIDAKAVDYHRVDFKMKEKTGIFRIKGTKKYVIIKDGHMCDGTETPCSWRGEHGPI